MIYNVGVMLLNNTLTTCHIFYLYAIEFRYSIISYVYTKLPYTLQGMKMMMALNMILDEYISRDKKVS